MSQGKEKNMHNKPLERPGKRPHRSLSNQEKLEAIDRVHGGQTKASVARDIGVPESTFRGWCKAENKLRTNIAGKRCSSSEGSFGDLHSPGSTETMNGERISIDVGMTSGSSTSGQYYNTTSQIDRLPAANIIKTSPIPMQNAAAAVDVTANPNVDLAKANLLRFFWWSMHNAAYYQYSHFLNGMFNSQQHAQLREQYQQQSSQAVEQVQEEETLHALDLSKRPKPEEEDRKDCIEPKNN